MERRVCFWFAELGGLPAPRAPLPGPRTADVCIVGAGLTGLWTAYELRRADPALDVVVLDAEVAGFGASGRNGGWVSGELAGSRERRAARSSRAAVQALDRAIRATVDEVGAVVAREGIECAFHKGGSLHVAQTPLQLARLEALVAEDRAWGLSHRDSRLLGAAEVAGRVAVAGALGAQYSPHCARVQPARLVRGLAAAAERAGAVLHEATPVTAIEAGRVRTPRGDVRAPLIVRATEGYTARLPGRRRELLPLGSSMLVTEPLGDQTWSRLGWAGAETLLDGQRLYAYLQRTADGRIAIGGRGVPYRWGSATDREGPVPPATVDALRRRLGELFAGLEDVAVVDAWHGVLGVPRDWSPRVWLDRATGLATAGGYAGEGVAAANLAGRTLRDLLLGRRTELTELPWVEPPGRSWEPEPLRFAGVRGVHALMAAADRREARTGRPAALGRLAARAAGT
jgi:glycine/D-amino acid oxidase-like deaminating enzyme